MITPTQHEINRLRHALSDTRNLQSCYEILAAYGEMERTQNGYRALDPGTIQRRAKSLLARLETAKQNP